MSTAVANKEQRKAKGLQGWENLVYRLYQLDVLRVDNYVYYVEKDNYVLGTEIVKYTSNHIL